MIIVRAPNRVSFFGSSSDYRLHFEKHSGLSLNCSINRHSWFCVKPLLPFFPFKSKFTYSDVETVQNHSQVQHKVIKAALDYLQVPVGIDLAHLSDLFSKCGLGSSSTFLVGLVTAILAYLGHPLDKDMIANTAITIEQHILKEHVGYQDSLAATYGGLNLFRYSKEGVVSRTPLDLSPDFTTYLEQSCLLFFTGTHRVANDLTSQYVPTLLEKEKEQLALMEVAEWGLKAFYAEDLMELGRLLTMTWHIKKNISPLISTPTIDQLFRDSINAGARGFKLLGSGGGGTFLVIAEPEKHAQIRSALSGLVEIPFRFDWEGTKVVYNDMSVY